MPDHWSAAIQVVRYLKGTWTMGLTLGGTNPLRLVRYSDSNYANCPITSRSISGYCFTLGSGTISWMSKKQHVVANSSCYAEYIALHDSSHELVFLCQLLTSLGFRPTSLTPILCDNDATRQLAECYRLSKRPNCFHGTCSGLGTWRPRCTEDVSPGTGHIVPLLLLSLITHVTVLLNGGASPMMPALSTTRASAPVLVPSPQLSPHVHSYHPIIPNPCALGQQVTTVLSRLIVLSRLVYFYLDHS